MNLLNPYVIIRDHLNTLGEGRNLLLRIWIIFVFYGTPIAFGVAAYYIAFEVKAGELGTLITVFSVFAALLFSAQISAFTISLGQGHTNEDPTLAKVQKAKTASFLAFLEQLNANISYLILVACVGLLLFFFLSVSDQTDLMTGCVCVALVTHFFGTLLMVLKRTHVAFKLAYR
ncbi:MAG: hypothetical protein AAFR53_13050 [Pseudomonadota bacterium]